MGYKLESGDPDTVLLWGHELKAVMKLIGKIQRPSDEDMPLIEMFVKYKYKEYKYNF